MNEFIDPDLGRMVAVASVGCKGCAYLRSSSRCLRAPQCYGEARDDGQSVIWIRAEDATKKPAGVRLTDEQVYDIETDHCNRAYANGEHFDREAFARTIETAVLRANNLEAE